VGSTPGDARRGRGVGRGGWGGTEPIARSPLPLHPSTMSTLAAVSALLARLPFRVLLVGHCACVASWTRALSPNFMASYWVGFVAAFGGGVIR
jgi:hypothetical protein